VFPVLINLFFICVYGSISVTLPKVTNPNVAVVGSFTSSLQSFVNIPLLYNVVAHFANFKLEPIEGTFEKVNKIYLLEDETEGNSDGIQLYLILSYQLHFNI
jgi:hypothetical protein